MSTNPSKTQGQDALELQQRVAEAYADFVLATPDMESPAGHYVVFALAVKELAQAGADMNDLIRSLGRAYGIEFEELNIVDGDEDKTKGLPTSGEFPHTTGSILQH